MSEIKDCNKCHWYCQNNENKNECCGADNICCDFIAKENEHDGE